MNCHDFNEWLQSELDARSDLRLPAEHSKHYHECDSCRGQLDAWNQIAYILPTDSSPRIQVSQPSPAGLPWLTGVSALAIAGLLALLIFGVSVDSTSTTIAPIAMVDPISSSNTTMSLNHVLPSQLSSSQSHDSADLAVTDVIDPNVDPSFWWQSMQQRDWISRTMPTVQSVRDGVAPIGRSFADAVRILTTGGRETPS